MEALHDELAPLGIHVTVVEPGYFRADFLDATSLSVSGNIIGDYAETVGKVRTVAASLSHNQPGDPQKLAEVLIAFTDAPNPPVSLPLGRDTVAAIEKKHAQDAASSLSGAPSRCRPTSPVTNDVTRPVELLPMGGHFRGLPSP